VFGRAVLEFVLDGVVFRGTERTVQEQASSVLFVEFVPLLVELPERDVACVEVKFPDSLLGGEVLIEVPEELCLQVEIAFYPCDGRWPG
jgi:hypothetical protein